MGAPSCLVQRFIGQPELERVPMRHIRGIWWGDRATIISILHFTVDARADGLLYNYRVGRMGRRSVSVPIPTLRGITVLGYQPRAVRWSSLAVIRNLVGAEAEPSLIIYPSSTMPVPPPLLPMSTRVDCECGQSVEECWTPEEPVHQKDFSRVSEIFILSPGTNVNVNLPYERARQ